MGEITFRTMTQEELGTAVAWAAEEGWNPGLHDADCFWPVDPEGFFCAEEDGRIVGTVSIVNYDDRFSFAGLYIVEPVHRDSGIGMQLYHHALRHAGSRIVGYDGVVAMVDKYRSRSGLFFHYNNARYEGTGGGAMPADLVSLRKVNFADLAAYDAQHFPARRESFLRRWIGQQGHLGLALTNDSGEILGYGVRRVCHRGHKIGPLFARDRPAAERLLDGLVAGIPGEPFFLDIPVPNADAVALVKDRSMTPVFFTARLYSMKDPVPLPLNEIFGVTTFELG